MGKTFKEDLVKSGIPKKLDSGRMIRTLQFCTPEGLDSGRMNAWTLDTRTLGLWTTRRFDAWSLDN